MTRPAKHATVSMTSPAGEVIDIDVKLATIIRTLWDQGVTTWTSCQDVWAWWVHAGEAAPAKVKREATIGFPDISAAQSFKDRYSGGRPGWRVGYETDHQHGGQLVSMIWFPTADVKWIEKQMKEGL